MKNIKLYNRYNSDVHLEYLSKNRYVLKGDLDYMRFIYDSYDFKDICAVDPSGGPFIHINAFAINNDKLILRKIENVDNNIILHFEECQTE
jgi:hypothetical protein